MVGWTRRINGAMSGDIARAISSRSFFWESYGAIVRSLVGSATGRESGITDEFLSSISVLPGNLVCDSIF